jgi:hypothetical protein
MPSVRLGLALLLLLAAGTVGHANVPMPIYKSDPGYERARIAAWVAPYAVLVAVVLAVVWAGRERSRAGKVTAGVFGVLALLWGGVMMLGSAGTSFPDEQTGQVNAVRASNSWFLRPRGSPRPMTPEETILAGLLVFAVLCFGGLALVRTMARQSHGKGQPPDQSDKTVGP